jgi:hypothetical protein
MMIKSLFSWRTAHTSRTRAGLYACTQLMLLSATRGLGPASGQLTRTMLSDATTVVLARLRILSSARDEQDVFDEDAVLGRELREHGLGDLVLRVFLEHCAEGAGFAHGVRECLNTRF